MQIGEMNGFNAKRYFLPLEALLIMQALVFGPLLVIAIGTLEALELGLAVLVGVAVVGVFLVSRYWIGKLIGKLR